MSANHSTQTASSADVAYRPYISTDVLKRGPSGIPQFPGLPDSPDSLYSNYMEEVKRNRNAVFYRHSGYGKGLKPNFCLVQFSNLGEGVAYRLSASNIKRYVHEESLPELFLNGQAKLYCYVESNTIILPTCREFPVPNKDIIDSYTYSDRHSFTICVDIGPNADDDIEVTFFDINNVQYKQRFFRIKNTATPQEYEEKVCRYRSDHPIIVQ